MRRSGAGNEALRFCSACILPDPGVDRKHFYLPQCDGSAFNDVASRNLIHILIPGAIFLSESSNRMLHSGVSEQRYPNP